MKKPARYMIWRKVVAVWVPLTGWHEAAEWEGLEAARITGFTKDQALQVINTNRECLPTGARFKIQPMGIFLRDELQ